MSGRAPRALFALASMGVCDVAEAHSFGRLYNLPIPFWLYAWGAAATLILSFLLVGLFITRPDAGGGSGTREVLELRTVRRARLPLLLKLASVAGLGLCIATGFLGTSNPYLNFNMTFFWIVFVLAFSWLTALWGDLFAVLNPWRLLIEAPGRWLAHRLRGRIAYPAALGCWPALLLYFAFIWFELFAQVRPWSLSLALLVYSLINLGGAWLVGTDAWFRHCEFFGVFLRQIAKLAPIELIAPDDGQGRRRLRWRQPLEGVLDQPANGPGELVFILFMLASTAFDGLHETAPWKQLLWIDLRHALEPVLGANIVDSYARLRQVVRACESLGLVLLPLLYLAAYLGALGLARRLTGSERPLRELALLFATSLIPIAFVYHVTHYFTLLVTQGPQILRLISDPFGYGWNLFGTARWLPVPTIPAMGMVWHAQVVLILLGHMASVVLAHRLALRIFPSRREAILSQLPMLGLMVALTTLGLWILALPITSANGALVAG